MFVLSVLPDIDLCLPGIQHRGPTHSIIVLVTFLLLFLMLFRKKLLIPYFVAVFQHSVADFLTWGRIQLFWPISKTWSGTSIWPIGPSNISLGWFSARL